MSRGDQRERDRAKAQAKQASKIKQQGKAGDPQARNASDGAALAAKVAAKKAKAETDAAGGNSSGGGSVPRKKAPSKKETVDDLLSAGLASNKSKARASK